MLEATCERDTPGYIGLGRGKTLASSFDGNEHALTKHERARTAP